MPIIKSAKKKMRQDKTRTLRNEQRKNALKKLIKSMRKTPSAKLLTQISSSLDKATKTNLIHTNKASRLKSRLSKLIASKPKSQTPIKTVLKKTSKNA